MKIELFSARKTLHDIVKLKNYIIMDIEYAPTGSAGNATEIVNIAAKYYKNNREIKQYNSWKMPPNSSNKAIDDVCIKKHQISENLKSKSSDDYNQLFLGFYKWLVDNSLTKSPIIGWGIGTDINKMSAFFKKNIGKNDSSRPMFEYDLQTSFDNHINANKALSLESMTNMLGVNKDNVHIGIEDVDTINEVKNKIKILIDTFGI